MPLKTIVKVDSITNLSDARYCAGMGVEMVGFNTIPDTDYYLTPTLYQEIRGWITGPSIVAEVYKVDSQQTVTEIVQHYSPDYLELAIEDLKCIPAINTLPLIVTVCPSDSIDDLVHHEGNVAFVLLTEANKALIEKLQGYKVLIKLRSSEALQSIVENASVKGITLSGSPEVRPGFKEYGDLAEVLEQLDFD